jgi:hypothetical protein
MRPPFSLAKSRIFPRRQAIAGDASVTRFDSVVPIRENSLSGFFKIFRYTTDVSCHSRHGLVSLRIQPPAVAEIHTPETGFLLEERDTANPVVAAYLGCGNTSLPFHKFAMICSSVNHSFLVPNICSDRSGPLSAGPNCGTHNTASLCPPNNSRPEDSCRAALPAHPQECCDCSNLLRSC